MSLHSVDAALAVAYRHRQPLCLIASRRQIDCAALGGGYVNDWTTEEFVHYVRARDPENLITLARDHGGPFQRDAEKSLLLPDAMAVAQASFGADILSGLKILHLDPEKAVERGAPGAVQQFTDLTIDMLLTANQFAQSHGITDVVFEIGTDEGIGEDMSVADWDTFLGRVITAAAAANANRPVTFAVPMGTKVKETRNVGAMAAGTDAAWQARVAALQELARKYNLILKLHNADYISAGVIERFMGLGVRCMNVAPELGVVESRTLVGLLRQNGLGHLADEFLARALASRKWERWLAPRSAVTDEEKALMAGHYVFAQPEVIALKTEAAHALQTSGINLPACLQQAIETVIEHYLLSLHASAKKNYIEQRAA